MSQHPFCQNHYKSICSMNFGTRPNNGSQWALPEPANQRKVAGAVSEETQFTTDENRVICVVRIMKMEWGSGRRILHPGMDGDFGKDRKTGVIGTKRRPNA